MEYMVPAFLLTIAALALYGRREEQAVTAGILLTNWAINTVFVVLSNSTAPWLLFMVVDYLAAMALFAVYVSRWQAFVIALYTTMLVTHAAFGVSEQGDWALYHYWWALFGQAMAQGIITGGWLVSEMVRDRARVGSSASPDLALACKKDERP